MGAGTRCRAGARWVQEPDAGPEPDAEHEQDDGQMPGRGQMPGTSKMVGRRLTAVNLQTSRPPNLQTSEPSDHVQTSRPSRYLQTFRPSRYLQTLLPPVPTTNDDGYPLLPSIDSTPQDPQATW
jgi:hypothetical protein